MGATRAAVAIVLSIVLLFSATTLVALEGGEVVLLRTVEPGGRDRETRTWVAEDGGAMWIEAANAERPFLRDLIAHPAVELRRAGVWRHCTAAPVPGPEGHAHIRHLLAARYGWRDRWVGLLTDTSGSVAVRVACE